MNYHQRSVWYEEVDTALYHLIKNTVCYKTETGEIKFVEPRFSMDEEDLKKTSLPTVLIRNTGEQFDLYRYDPTPIQIGDVDTENHQIEVEESAKPYTLHYQLDFLARYKVDINDILRSWYNAIPKRFLLDVKDSEGTDRKCYMLQVSPSTTLNKSYGENTVYRTCIKYDIKVELDEGRSSNVYVTTKINLGYK